MMANREVVDFVIENNCKLSFDLDHATHVLRLELWQLNLQDAWVKVVESQVQSRHSRRLARLLGEMTVVDEQAQP